MVEFVDINMGDLAVASAPFTLTTSSIGSCVAVCLYSPTVHSGGLAHVMLPKRPESSAPLSDSDKKFADIAIALMVNELEKNGISRNKLIAKIAGGANMFPDVQGRSHKIGEKNIEAVRTVLQEFGIRLAAEEVGGTSGRALTFDLSNGIVTIKVTI